MSRVVLVTEAFHPAVDESTITVRHLADELVKVGHQVLLISAAPGMAVYRRSRVVRIRPWEPVGSQVRAGLSEFRPDLVLVASPGTIGRKALKHAQRLGVPTVSLEHRAPNELSVEPWQTRVPGRSDLLLTVSRWQQLRLTETGHDCLAWQPGVDIDTFTPEAREPHLHARWARTHHPEGPLTAVGYVGPLRRRDGVRRLQELNALPGIRPVVIGHGRQREWLRDRMRRITFLPDLSSVELARAIASLDVLVHPGEELTSGHAVRAATACGVPVVAARAGAAPELVRHLETGLLFEPRADEFVDEVAALVSDRSRAEFGRHARAEAERRTWAAATGELLDLVAPLLAPARAA